MIAAMRSFGRKVLRMNPSLAGGQPRVVEPVAPAHDDDADVRAPGPDPPDELEAARHLGQARIDDDHVRRLGREQVQGAGRLAGTPTTTQLVTDGEQAGEALADTIVRIHDEHPERVLGPGRRVVHRPMVAPPAMHAERTLDEVSLGRTTGVAYVIGRGWTRSASPRGGASGTACSGSSTTTSIVVPFPISLGS